MINKAGGHYYRDEAHRRMACKNEDEIDDGRRWHYTPSLMQRYVNCSRKVEQRGHTDRLNTSAGVAGVFWISEGRRQDLRIFLILGASCKFPSVFCRDGTGWYVRRAVLISGKTGETTMSHGLSLKLARLGSAIWPPGWKNYSAWDADSLRSRRAP